MNPITRFFHELFNPHCEHCVESLRESRICNSCEYLKLENARLHQENGVLLDKLINKPIKTEPKVAESVVFKPINTGLVQSWAVKRQMLEQESRHAAKLIKEKKEEASKNGEKTITELEDKLFEKELAEAENARTSQR